MIPKPLSKQSYNEAILWTIALIVLALLPPGTNEHFTVCIPHLLGFSGCMGCGIGESVGYCLRGDIQASMHAHIVGPFAVVVIAARIATLVFRPHFLKR